ncbi:MAG: hypothetical protein Q4C83_01040 [Candidatus Saccharibacteria bacterium]|nr:hypothetical protein [Candidatus Saccharibacteria bacterium]
MHKVIRVKENNGKVEVRLYGKTIDLTGCVFNGKAELRVFGDDYEVYVDQPAQKKKPKGPKPLKRSEHGDEISKGD